MPLLVLFFFSFCFTMNTQDQNDGFTSSAFTELGEFFVDKETAKTVQPVDNHINELIIIKPYVMASVTHSLSEMSEFLYRSIDARVIGPDKYKIAAMADYRFVRKMIEFKSVDPQNKRRARIVLSNSSTRAAMLNFFTVTETDSDGEIMGTHQYVIETLQHDTVHMLVTAVAIAKWIKHDVLELITDQQLQATAPLLN